MNSISSVAMFICGMVCAWHCCFIITASVQVLSSIADEEYSISSLHAGKMLSSKSEAVALPAKLMVKWLRTDCLTRLDLRGVPLTDASWNSLVMSFGAIPGLLALHARLPRYEFETKSLSPCPEPVIPANKIDVSAASPKMVVHGIWCPNCLAGTQDLGSGQPPKSIHDQSKRRPGVCSNAAEPCTFHWKGRPTCTKCELHFGYSSTTLPCFLMARPPCINIYPSSSLPCRESFVCLLPFVMKKSCVPVRPA